MSKKPELYLIDGSSYIYRAYYAIRHLSSPTGFPTNALYGFIQMLLKVVKDRQPDHLAVVFDAGRRTFRHNLHPEYKANRIAMPEDLRQQLGPIKEAVRAFNIPVLELEGYEADDIIGTIACECENRGMAVVVVTGDKDLMQIVTDDVTLLDTMKDKVSGPTEVFERFGVGPDRVVDVLGLAGDSSDNIPGVPGIGEKTAIKLITEFGSLDQLLQRAHEVKGKVGERLQEFAEQARLSRTLATIDCHVPITCSYEDFAASAPDNRRLAELFKEYGFTTLMKDLTSVSTLSTENYGMILSRDDFAALLEKILAAPSLAIELQTTSPNPREAEIVGISLSFREHEAYYIPVGHSYEGAPAQLPLPHVLGALGSILADPERPKIGHNLKFCRQVLSRQGITIGSLWFDTMIASYLVNPTRSNHRLDALAVEYLDHKMVAADELLGKGREQKSFAQVEVEKACRFACEAADTIFLLQGLLQSKLKKSGGDELFHDLEMPLVAILAEMELAGVKLDLPLLRSLSENFGDRLSRLEGDIFRHAGVEFNINSPKQLGEVLFERLQLPCGKKTKTKTGWSTDVDELERLAQDQEICRLILQYRSLAKLKSTYTDALQKLAEEDSGRIHTFYNQAVTNTGRLSSSEPNLQNIPIRTEEGRSIRHAFIAADGCLLLSADYSQIELRVLAHLSEDEVFCDAFARDEDIHTRTAAEVFGLFPQLVTPEMRRQAKTINFGVIYGQSPFGLAKELGLSTKVAKNFIDNYFARHAGARSFLDRCIGDAEKNGFVTTILGRHLPIPDINSSNGNVRSFAQRNAINYPIQGSAADIIKRAMVRVTDQMGREKLESRLIMQVHDELVFEVPHAEKVVMAQLVKLEMERAVPLRVPLKVEVNFGANWSEAH